MIHVIATITLNPGAQEKFLAIFKANIPAVLAEKGCLRYEPTVDLETGLPPQGGARKNVVTIVEAWESLAALRAHLNAPHMLAYKEQVKAMVASVALQVTEPV